MKKNIIIGLLIAVVFAMGIFVGCSSGNASSDVPAENESATTLVSGAQALEGKKVYIVTPSTGFACGNETVQMLEVSVDEESAPFLKVAHNGKEYVDEASGVTFVYTEDTTPSDKMVIYDVDGMSVEKLQGLQVDDFTKETGAFESSYGKCYVLSE